MAGTASFLQFSTPSQFLSSSKTRMYKIQISSSPSSYKPIKASSTMVQIQTCWAGDINSEVEDHIERALAGQKRESVLEPISHLLLKTPKSLAPALCVAACEAVGGDKEQAIPAASALHLMHVATFTHEHLEFTDQPKRRAMAHHGFGPKTELLSADHMIPIGYELLAASDNTANNDPDRILRVMIEIGRSMGSQGMVNGIFLKLKCMGVVSDEPCEEDALYQAIENLGGALYSCGGACGAIIGGGSKESVEKLRRYGVCVGIIHNIMAHEILAQEKVFMKLADSLRFLALQELNGMDNKKIDRLSSIMDGFTAFLSTQEYRFPKRM